LFLTSAVGGVWSVDAVFAVPSTVGGRLYPTAVLDSMDKT
jgi:hypothetical protein